MKSLSMKVIAGVMVVGLALFMAACGSDEDGDNGTPGGNGNASSNGNAGSNGSIPERNFFAEDEWNYYVSEIESDSVVLTRTWSHDEDGSMSTMATGTIESSHGSAFSTGAKIEDRPDLAMSARLAEGSGPVTMMLYRGHELVDEATMTQAGDRVILVSGEVVAEPDTGLVAPSGDPEPGAFIASFAGLGHNLELEGEARYLPNPGAVDMTIEAATEDGDTVFASGTLRLSWDDDLAEGSYSQEDGDPHRLRLRSGQIGWGEGSELDGVVYDDCEIALEVSTACSNDTACAGEATLTNCRVYKHDLNDPFPVPVGFGEMVLRFDSSNSLLD